MRIELIRTVVTITATKVAIPATLRDRRSVRVSSLCRRHHEKDEACDQRSAAQQPRIAAFDPDQPATWLGTDPS
jgi:hypothetical protein